MAKFIQSINPINDPINIDKVVTIKKAIWYDENKGRDYDSINFYVKRKLFIAWIYETAKDRDKDYEFILLNNNR